MGGASESNISGEVARRAETSGERAELVAAVAGGMERSSSSTASFGEATKGEREVDGVESGRVGGEGVSSMICRGDPGAIRGVEATKSVIDATAFWRRSSLETEAGAICGEVSAVAASDSS